MSKTLFMRINWLCKSLSKNRKPQIIGCIQCSNIHTNEIQVKEVQIPVQWGHMSAKLWGSGEDRPILALHGWQDNAGTWDTLAPMLVKSKNRSILALDFPGHGLSSWIPPGLHYYSWEYPRLIYFVKEYFKWDKISILAHSMGSIGAFRFSCIYPDLVDFYVAIDSLIYDDFDLNLVADKYPQLISKLHTTQTRLDQEPPSYVLEDMIKTWHLGTRKSVNLESVPYLLKRGAKQSKNDPNKYYFSRDSRLKYTLFNPEKHKFVEALALRLKSPTLYVKAIESPYGVDAFSVEMCEVVEKNNSKFERHFVPGTHHVHLNNPEIILPLILDFMKKYNV